MNASYTNFINREQGRVGHLLQGRYKAILFERDSAIEIPMLRTQLSAEELKEIVEKARVNMIIGDPGILVTPLQ